MSEFRVPMSAPKIVEKTVKITESVSDVVINKIEILPTENRLQLTCSLGDNRRIVEIAGEEYGVVLSYVDLPNLIVALSNKIEEVFS